VIGLAKAWVVIALCLVGAAQVRARTDPTQTERFVWRYGAHEFGTLDVPSGFTADTENYTEGIVTRLHYADGSCIVLQRGFMYRIPMFQDPEHILDSSRRINKKAVRRGHYANKPEVWGEDDFGLLNLGFAHVPRIRRREFASAIESFLPSH
jgi:hypothetical protein